MSGIKTTIQLMINGKMVEAAAGTSILEAARENGVEIPTLCYHPKLSTFGACRLCIVDVKGKSRYTTACNTPIETGMEINTHTPAVVEARQEILRLILSTHPSGCLLCSEQVSCGESMVTIRKVGVVTGCSNCPKNGRCELQEVVQHIGLGSVNYPTRYRGLKVERNDPFIDRDYNLCILCGRCVQACQELRLANVLTFKMRGPETLVGTTFEESFLSAGCEFCGTCVDMCPTGALSERATKWFGCPEQVVQSTCALCGVGCQIDLSVRNGRVIGATGIANDPVSNGMLCVKGRFALPELVNNPARATKPVHIQQGQALPVGWEEALKLAAEKISQCPPDRFGMLVSADCTNEDMFVAKKFVSAALHSNRIDVDIRSFYRNSLTSYARIFMKSAPIESLHEADVIIAIGLDTQYSRSTIGAAIHKAQRRGARLVSIHPGKHNLARTADILLKAANDKEAVAVLNWIANTDTTLAELDPVMNDANRRTSRWLQNASHPIILLGPEIFRSSIPAEMLVTVENLAASAKAQIVALPARANFGGAIWLGLGEWDSEAAFNGESLRVFYGIGTFPQFSSEHRPAFTILQDLFVPEDREKINLFFPAAAFTEIDGTMLTGGRKLRQVSKVAPPFEDSLPDWKILTLLAQKMGLQGFNYANVEAVQAEMFMQMPGLEQSKEETSIVNLPYVKLKSSFPYPEQYIQLNEDTYRAYSLDEFVKGMKELS